MKRIAFLVLVGFAFLSPSNSLRADPIAKGGGVWGNAVIPGGVAGAEISFVAGLFTFVQPPQTASDAIGTITPIGSYAVSPLHVDLAPFTSNPGTINILGGGTLTVTGLPPAGTDSGKTAVFSFMGGMATLEEKGVADPITGIVQLQSSNITRIDFGPIGDLFAFEFSVQGLQFTPGAGGGSVTGTPTSSSFGLTRLPPIPEPASLALWGLIGAAGIWYARHRRLRAA
ncbi:MAG: hypothetical protein L0Z62_20575 [Gemmataceae bacterium]|nr:hypothetical protein [Gemmataceae bacterium]